MTTEQMIEEALKEFEREFIDKVQIGEDEYDVALKDKPQDMFDFLKEKLTTIATKSAEEEQERLVKVVENMGFDVENTTGYEDEDLWNLIEQEKVVKELSQPKGHQ